MRKRNYSAHAADPRLKVSKRVKTRCCYRIKGGRMCGRFTDFVGSPSDYCAEHALKVLQRSV